MQRFKANSTWGRYRLIEELSFDPAQGQQVWAILDLTTNQRLIGRFWGEGQVEWYTDNRPAPGTVASAASGNTGTTPPPPPPPNIPEPAPMAAPVAPPTVAPVREAGTRSRTRYGWLVAIGLLVVGVAGYTGRDAIGPLFGRVSGNAPAAETPADSISDDIVETASTNPSPLLTGGRRRLEQANRQLQQVSKLPPAQQATTFTEAREVFTHLRATSFNETYMDSLSGVYTRLGAISRASSQQNGDSVSKWYAIQWYRIAYALNPQPGTQALIDHLERVVPARKTVPHPQRHQSPGFMADPELNQ